MGEQVYWSNKAIIEDQLLDGQDLKCDQSLVCGQLQSSTTHNAGQSNLAKTANCVFLSRKGDILELPPPQISMLFLKCCLWMCYHVNIDIGGGGGGGQG